MVAMPVSPFECDGLGVRGVDMRGGNGWDINPTPRHIRHSDGTNVTVPAFGDKVRMRKTFR